MTKRLKVCLLSIVLLGTFLFADNLSAHERQKRPRRKAGGKVNLTARTFGGLQLWADELVFHDWRIQRQVYTGHCRLLDSENVRHAWGTFEHCQAELEKLKTELHLPPMPEKVVIVLHGILRSRGSMTKMGEHLQAGGYGVVYVSYPSSRRELGEHAASLAKVVEHLDGVKEINFVAHSLGNLVIRHYLGDQIKQRKDHGIDPRIKRIVMLAPPNKGSQVAAFFKDYKLLKYVWGESALQLGKEWKTVQHKLATPPVPFGIIAGGQQRKWIPPRRRPTKKWG